jgi:hypothetical protein
VSIDETTGVSGRKVADVFIGVLKKRSNAVREIISLVIPGNVCSESHNNSTCLH